MPSTVPPPPTEAATGCLVRDARIAAAIAEASHAAFPPLAGRREIATDVLQRLLEDLQLADAVDVLILSPPSGLVPILCSRLVRHVTVVSTNTADTGFLADQLGRAGTANIRLLSFVPRAEAGSHYDAVLSLAWSRESPATELAALLGPRARVIAPIEEGVAPRRFRRWLRLPDGAFTEDEVDLVRFLPLLGDLLVEAGAAMRQEVAEAARAARANGRLLGDELLVRGAVREDDLYRALALQRQLPFTQTAHALVRLDPQLARQLPRKFLDHYRFLPIERKGDRVAVVTTNCELPTWELRAAFEAAEILAELVTPTDLQRIWTALELGVTAARSPVEVAATPTPAPTPELPQVDSRAAGLLDALLLDAVAERASDIHLECYEQQTRLRFRIDGSLHDIGRYELGREDTVALLNVVKIAAGLDIAERRAPQGGRIRRRTGGRSLDLRVQTQPTLHQEAVVIRILPQDLKPPTIEDLGFAPAVAERYRRALRNPQGLLLVVGATGSGKSTTLYAGLQLLAKDTTRKVITIEDPIEYSLVGVQQTQVNAAVGFRFADAVRSFVRQDPDVILVGEVRDAETALEAIRAAQTGHLVLATMHCNDTVDAVQRLTDLGMHPNSVASELTTVIAQRLARRICTACRSRTEPRPELLAELFPAGPPADFACFEGRGCDRCNGTGTRGRIAVVEMLTVDPAIRRAISRGALLDDLRHLAHGSGMCSLRDSALQLVQEGSISVAELYDVLSAEQMQPIAWQAPRTAPG